MHAPRWRSWRAYIHIRTRTSRHAQAPSRHFRVSYSCRCDVVEHRAFFSLSLSLSLSRMYPSSTPEWTSVVTLVSFFTLFLARSSRLSLTSPRAFLSALLSFFPSFFFFFFVCFFFLFCRIQRAERKRRRYRRNEEWKFSERLAFDVLPRELKSFARQKTKLFPARYFFFHYSRLPRLFRIV